MDSILFYTCDISMLMNNISNNFFRSLWNKRFLEKWDIPFKQKKNNFECNWKKFNLNSTTQHSLRYKHLMLLNYWNEDDFCFVVLFLFPFSTALSISYSTNGLDNKQDNECCVLVLYLKIFCQFKLPANVVLDWGGI